MDSIDKSVIKAVSALIEYLKEEEQDYLQNPTNDHVFLSVRTLKGWLASGIPFEVAGSVSEALNATHIREVNVSYSLGAAKFQSITRADQVAEYVRGVIADNSREHFVALYLDGANQVVAYSVVSIGTANAAHIHPREVFQRAVLVGAISVVVAHNHPSGETKLVESCLA